jgi:hypothetical protein
MMIKLKCPKCGAGIKHWFYLEDAATSRNILEREGNTLHITTDYEVEHPIDENPALRENSEKRPIGGDLSVLPFLGWLASGFQPGAADLGQLSAESIAVSESLESWNSRIVWG